MKLFYLVATLLVFCISAYSFDEYAASNQSGVKAEKIITGAEQPDEYLPYLKGKRVGILANPTTITGDGSCINNLVSGNSKKS